MWFRTLESQLDLAQKSYSEEASRRDSVRGAIALPLAVLTFSAFGFGALLTHFDLSRATPALHLASFAVVLLALVSAGAYLLAICALYRIDYKADGPQPLLVDVADQERDLFE